MPDELAEVGRLLRERRPQLDALELVNIESRVSRRLAAAQRRGNTVRGRILVALLSVGMMVGGTGTVLASSPSGSTGSTSATSQYRNAHCNHNGNVCGCPDHSVLGYYNGDFVCSCPSGQSFDANGNHCSGGSGGPCMDGHSADKGCPPPPGHKPPNPPSPPPPNCDGTGHGPGKCHTAGHYTLWNHAVGGWYYTWSWSN